MMNKTIKTLWPIYLMYLVWGFNLILPIYTLFLMSRGMNFTELGALVSIAFLFVLVFDYPTSVFADKFGRKFSLNIALIISMASLVVDIYAHSFWIFVISFALQGISQATLQGIMAAHIYDILKDNRLQKNITKASGQMNFLYFIGTVVSAPFGSFLYTIDKTLPFWALIGLNVVAMFFFQLVPEPKYKKHTMDHWEAFKSGFKLLIKNKTLFSILLINLTAFLFTEAWYVQQQPALVSLGIPVAMLGFYYSARNLFPGIAGLVFPKLFEKVKNKEFLVFLFIIGGIMAYFGLALDNLWIVIGSAILFVISGSIWDYTYISIVHKHIPSSIRATTLSAESTLINTITLPMPWLMGILVNHFSRNILLTWAGILTGLITLPIFFWRKRYLK